MSSKNEEKFKELLQSLVDDINDIEDFPDRIYTILAFKYILEKKDDNIYGKIVFPLMAGKTKDLILEKVTMKFESYFRYLLEEFDSF